MDAQYIFRKDYFWFFIRKWSKFNNNWLEEWRVGIMKGCTDLPNRDVAALNDPSKVAARTRMNEIGIFMGLFCLKKH